MSRGYSKEDIDIMKDFGAGKEIYTLKEVARKITNDTRLNISYGAFRNLLDRRLPEFEGFCFLKQVGGKRKYGEKTVVEMKVENGELIQTSEPYKVYDIEEGETRITKEQKPKSPRIVIKDVNGNILMDNDTLTVDGLSKVIKNITDKYGTETESIRGTAQHVLNFFGYSDRIIDNVLEPEDRDAFYMLEDSGILTTEREEATIYDGRVWRIHYWLFRKDFIRELLSEKEETEQEEEITIYDEISEDVWKRCIEDEKSPA